jgi:hypothetical protein
LGGRRFHSNEEAKWPFVYGREWQRPISTATVFFKLVPGWDKRINVPWDYVEKQ